jgi:hypothetical protein
MPWLDAEVQQHSLSTAGHLSYWRGTHDGYLQRGLATRHTRSVLRIGDEHWLVCDNLDSPVHHDYRLHWLLCDASFDVEELAGIVLHTPSGDYQVQVASSACRMESSLLRADANGPRGWRSAYYMHREPALSAEYMVHAKVAAFWTILGPKGFRFDMTDSNLRIETRDWEASLSKKPSNLLLDSVTVSGTIDDTLEF